MTDLNVRYCDECAKSQRGGIGFKHGDAFVVVYESSGEAKVTISRDHTLSQKTVYFDKTLYHLLQQAMPHIEAIVDGDAPEIFPGTNKALDKIGVRKE